MASWKHQLMPVGLYFLCFSGCIFPSSVWYLQIDINACFLNTIFLETSLRLGSVPPNQGSSSTTKHCGSHVSGLHTKYTKYSFLLYHISLSFGDDVFFHKSLNKLKLHTFFLVLLFCLFFEMVFLCVALTVLKLTS